MALVRHLFGRTITFRYIPAVDGEEHTAYSLTSARIYSSKPTAAQVANTDTGHIEEVTSWTLINEEGTGPAEYKITFAAIADSDPDSTDPYEKYYVALNYKAQSGSVSLQDWELCPIYREDGFTGKIRVSAQDIYDLDRSIEDLARDEPLAIEAKIDAAREEIVHRIKAQGYPKDQVFNWEELNACTRRLALAYCCFELAGDGNQFWFTKGEKWEASANKMFDSTKFGFDAYNSDDPEPDTKIQTGAVAFLR